MNSIQSKDDIKRIVGFSILAVFLVIALRSYYFYTETREQVIRNAKKEAQIMQDYLMAMRHIYLKQFLKSGVELTDKTIGLLPAHASSLISDEFIRTNKYNFYIKNVSDNPRNPANIADREEMLAIDHFKSHTDETEYFKTYVTGDTDYYQYASPIRMQEYCLNCHGQKESAAPNIQKLYDTAYGYKVGDLRGIVSIKIPQQNVDSMLHSFIKKELLLAFTTLAMIVTFILFLYRKVIFQIKHTEDKASHYATTDALTGLHNRHYLEEFNPHQKNFHDETQKFAVAFIDIDHFKHINDTYGHDIGDSILKALAAQLKAMTRPEDVLCRYGGEEFLILLYNISSEAAYQKLETLRQNVEITPLHHHKEKTLTITISVGLSMGGYYDELSKVITEADMALYKAKTNGRNRTELFKN